MDVWRASRGDWANPRSILTADAWKVRASHAEAAGVRSPGRAIGQQAARCANVALAAAGHRPPPLRRKQRDLALAIDQNQHSARPDWPNQSARKVGKRGLGARALGGRWHCHRPPAASVANLHQLQPVWEDRSPLVLWPALPAAGVGEAALKPSGCSPPPHRPQERLERQRQGSARQRAVTDAVAPQSRPWPRQPRASTGATRNSPMKAR